MKISPQTVEILKNFAGIAPVFMVEAGDGNVIRSCAAGRNIVAKASILEELPPFQVYDLKGFITTLAAFDDPDLDFREDHVIITSGKATAKFIYCNKNLVDPKPPRNVKLPEEQVKFVLPRAVIQQVMKGCGVVGADELEVKNVGGRLVLAAVPGKNEGGGNEFSVDVCESPTDKPYSFIFLTDVFKFIPSDYAVSLHTKIAQFEAKLSDTYSVTYWTTVSADSKFG